MKKVMNGKIAMIVTVAALCLTGCGKDGMLQEETAISSENLPGMVKVEETEDTKEAEEMVSSVQEPESQEDILEKDEAPVDYDIQEVLEGAEKEVLELRKKLQEDISLTQGDMNTISDEIYQVWDGALNELWEILKSTLDKETMDSLLQEQRAWITEKEEEVKKAGDEFGGGSMAPMIASQRAAELTRARVYELASYLGFEGTMITFSIEGTEEIVPANVFEGLHYTISIPVEGWEMIATECWASDANRKVQFWVTDYAGEDMNSVQEKLVGSGYERIEYDPSSMRYEDEEGMIHLVRMFTENEETIGIFSCYPKETEEGFGARIRTIINTFEWDIK
uniref:lysozyme inhibitor LprI family protein n=1 Tax=Agathobacter sp. TaxID=2021311 RepID=UPI0040565A6F